MAITLTSTTSSKEEMEHAAGDNWREPFVPPAAPEVETEAPETEETPVKTADESETPENNESEKQPKPKSKYQRTIDRLTARNHAAETRAEKAERELEELRSKATERPTEQEAQPSGPPKLQDFLNAGKTADEWADARDAWKQDQETRQAQADQLKTTFDSYNKHVSEARGRYEDWDEVVTGNELEIPSSVQLAVIEMDNGPDVAYHLAKNPKLCEELLEMTPLSAVRKVGQIAESLKPSETRSPAAPKPRVTPPPPIQTVGGSSSRSSIPLDQLSPREYIRVRNQQTRGR